MAPDTNQKTRELYEFGPFRVDAEKELLLRDDEAVPLAPKAFQVLLVLVRHGKRVVSKDDLMKTIWPDTFVEEANLSRNIFLLRKALGESPQDHQYIVTVPGRGYRFTEDVQLVPERKPAGVATGQPNVAAPSNWSRHWKWFAAAVLALAVLAVAAIRVFVHRSVGLTAKDTVILADFANSTGDPVFDETLRQGLAVELEQSPFLSLIPEQRIQQTLKMMGQPSDARLAPQIARDLCQRTQSAAYLTGSIASLGSQYVLGLKAVSCPAGEILAEEQETAAGKEKVLAALDTAAGKLRATLGESLKTVERFDTPLEQATTPSLEALQAYTLGRKTQVGKDEFAVAVPFYLRAIQFDPKFAMAYSALGSVYWNLGETVQGSEYTREAFDLRASVSEPEKFYIESTYYHFGVGDFDKARQVYETSAETYPRYSGVPLRLWQLSSEQGRYDRALNYIRAAIQLDPSRGINYRCLVSSLIHLERLDEAAATARNAIAGGFDSSTLHLELYKLAFLENDATAMAWQTQSVASNANIASWMLESEAATAAFSGRLRESHNLSQRAAETARRAEEEEVATDFEANTALIAALFNRSAGAGAHAELPPTTHAGNVALYAMALSLALNGDSARAKLVAGDLARRYPQDTLVQFNFLPTVRAQIALNSNDPQTAIDLLQPAALYELSDVAWDFLGPIYVRGEAYLAARRGNEAAAEFQKLIDHRGVVANSPSGALAWLEIARASALSGDKEKARASYQRLLAIWKNADPDLPTLLQAKVELARLH